MRAKDIIKKVKKHKVWVRRSGDTWCELEVITIKEILWRKKDANMCFISIEEKPVLWPPRWLWEHYEPKIYEGGKEKK